MAAPTATRLVLSERQSATVEALLAAGLAELRDGGFDGLSIRTVAIRAGVTHTTAYSYFTSKAHLVAEIYARQLREMGPPDAGSRTLAEGILRAFAEPAMLSEREPELAQAALVALLAGDDPEVARLREGLGEVLGDRLRLALGADADPVLIETILIAFSGAMLHAGMGYFEFSGVVERMAAMGRLLDGSAGTRPTDRRGRGGRRSPVAPGTTGNRPMETR